MRISTTMVMKNYAKQLNDKYETINKYDSQINSTLAFQRGSEDPVNYMKSLESCTEYTINQQQQQTEKEAASWMTTTESTLNSLNKIIMSVSEKATEAANGTNNTTDYATFAADFTSYRDELVSTLNISYNGQYIYGESASGPAPFRIGTPADGAAFNGKLLYYNYNNAPGMTATAGYVALQDYPKSTLSTLNLSSPVQVGSNYNFDIATSAIDTVVNGMASSGTAVNLVDQLSNAISLLNSGTSSGMSSLVTAASKAQSAVTTVDVTVGEKSNMLKQIAGTLTDNETNLTDSLANTMEVDTTKAIMNFNMAQTVYKESMSMASSILQNSLFDFLK